MVAAAAIDRGVESYAVTGFEIARLGTGFHYFAGSLMPHHERRDAPAGGAVQTVDIAPANAAGAYADEDVIEPEVEVSGKGTIRVPTAPGIGYQVRCDRIEKLTVRSETFSTKSQASVLAV